MLYVDAFSELGPYGLKPSRDFRITLKCKVCGRIIEVVVKAQGKKGLVPTEELRCPNGCNADLIKLLGQNSPKKRWSLSELWGKQKCSNKGDLRSKSIKPLRGLSNSISALGPIGMYGFQPTDDFVVPSECEKCGAPINPTVKVHSADGRIPLEKLYCPNGCNKSFIDNERLSSWVEEDFWDLLGPPENEENGQD